MATSQDQARAEILDSLDRIEATLDESQGNGPWDIDAPKIDPAKIIDLQLRAARLRAEVTGVIGKTPHWRQK